MDQAYKKDDGATMSIGTIALASAIGTTIEWYDFFLYGMMTPLVLNKLFFPERRHLDLDACWPMSHPSSASCRGRSAASFSAITATASAARPCSS